MSDKKEIRLFEAFPPIPPAEWEEQIRKDLKGKEPSALDWESGEGITLKAWYSAENAPAGAQELPGAAPFRRGGLFRAEGSAWQIVETLPAQPAGAALARLQEAREAGIYAFLLPGTEEALPELLGHIPLKNCALHIELPPGRLPALAAADVYMALSLQGQKPEALTGSLRLDPLSDALDGGPVPAYADLLSVEGAILAFRSSPSFRAVGLDLSWVYEQGGTLTQQIAFALSLLTEYLSALRALGSEVSSAELLRNIAVTLPAGGPFLPEIAKYRAFRACWALLVQSLGHEEAELQSPFVIARTSLWNKSAYDRHSNLLRLSTETLAAALGGAEAIAAGTYEEASGIADPSAPRLSRNLHRLLAHESYLDRVADPAGGSYYLEAVTEALGSAAWKLFQEIEAEGGFLAGLASGKIAERLHGVAEKRRWRLATRRSTVVGVNQYPDSEEMLAQPLPGGGPERLAAPFEQIRNRVDLWSKESGRRPLAFLLPFGDLTMRNARSQFARNLLGCGGIALRESRHPDDLEAALDELAAAAPDFVVLCSADPAYFDQGPALSARLRARLPHARLILAGKPEGWEQSGADEPIYTGMDAIESLARLTAPFTPA
jgi:methylmalonyl-CoA mutase